MNLPETAGMTTELWMQLPVVWLDIDTLTPTQPLVDKPIKRDCADPHIHVVEREGLLLVEDGHGRLTRAMARGEAQIRGRIYSGA